MEGDGYTLVPHFAGAEGDECPCELTVSDEDEMKHWNEDRAEGQAGDGGN